MAHTIEWKILGPVGSTGSFSRVSLYRQDCAEQIRRAENCMNPGLLFTRDRIKCQYRRENVLRLQMESTKGLIWC